ncbi:MAG: IS6 family transposase [Chloroflexota bacterium]|nr:IS6 family transposase [Chloroflexota bacterium]
MGKLRRDHKLEGEIEDMLKRVPLAQVQVVEAPLPDDIETVVMEKVHTTTPEVIACPRCGATDIMKYGVRNGQQEYICKRCRRKFTARNAPLGMHFSAKQIGMALSLFYDGLSLADVSRQIGASDGLSVNPATIWRWVMHYSKEAANALDKVRVSTSPVWVIDETVIKVGGENVWYWDVIDEGTRFLLGTHLSVSRRLSDAIAILNMAKRRSKTTPRFILSDGLAAYPDAVEQVFGASARHVKMQGLTSEINTNLIERFHGTLKERTKVMRGLKTMDSALTILNGFVLNYNFLRPHMTLDGKPPAEAAGVEVPFRSWIEFVTSNEMALQEADVAQPILSVEDAKRIGFRAGVLVRQYLDQQNRR